MEGGTGDIDPATRAGMSWQTGCRRSQGHGQDRCAGQASPVTLLRRSAVMLIWYRTFIQGMRDAEVYTWFAKLAAYGELLIGIALIVGAFMNWSIMLAGSATTSPMLFVFAVALILACKLSGYVGADFFLLRWIGTPWRAVPVKAER